MSNISSNHDGAKDFHMVLKRHYPFRYRYRDFRQGISNRWQRLDDWCETFKEERPLSYFAIMLIAVVLAALAFVGLAVMLNPLDKPGFNV